MSSDPFRPEAAEPPHDAAVIRAVTPEAMDDVAHRAAVLADGVAHHTIELQEPARHETAPADREDRSEIGEPEPAGLDSVELQFDVGEPEAVDDATSPVETVDIADPSAEQPRPSLADDAAAAGTRPSSAADGVGLYNARLFEMARVNMAATTSLFAALTQAKSLPEAVALNTDHLRRQMETLTEQGRELTDLFQKITLGAFQPLKDAQGGDR